MIPLADPRHFEEERPCLLSSVASRTTYDARTLYSLRDGGVVSMHTDVGRDPATTKISDQPTAPALSSRLAELSSKLQAHSGTLFFQCCNWVTSLILFTRRKSKILTTFTHASNAAQNASTLSDATHGHLASLRYKSQTRLHD